MAYIVATPLLLLLLLAELKTSFGVRDNVAYDDYNVDNDLGKIARA